MPRAEPFEEVMQNMSVEERKFINEEYKKAFKQRLAVHLNELVEKEVRSLMKVVRPGLKKKLKEEFEKKIEKEKEKLLQRAMKKLRIDIRSSYY